MLLKFAYVTENHYLYSVINERLHSNYLLKTALAGRINNSKINYG